MENITKIHNPYFEEFHNKWVCHIWDGKGIVATSYGDTPETAQSNAKLIADAGNTFNNCGLTPGELLEQNKIMREALD